MRPETKSAPGVKVDRPSPTRLDTRSEEQASIDLTPTERDALGKVYELLTEVARRALEQEAAA